MSTSEQSKRPKRLSLSEIVEMALAKGGASKRSSVSLSRNASGETLIEVTVAAGEHEEAATVEEAEAKALEVYERLTDLYRWPHGHDASTLTLSRNAKGETQIEVQTKTSDREGRRTLDSIAAEAHDTYDVMRGRYPMADGTTAKPGSVASKVRGPEPTMDRKG